MKYDSSTISERSTTAYAVFWKERFNSTVKYEQDWYFIGRYYTAGAMNYRARTICNKQQEHPNQESREAIVTHDSPL